MVKKLLFCFLILNIILIIPSVLAIDTEINVKTISMHKVSIRVTANTEKDDFLNSYNNLNSGDNGTVKAVHSGSESEIRVSITITKEGEEVMFERFGPFGAGSPLYLQVIPGKVSENYLELETTESGALEETNETEVPELEVIAEEETNETEVIIEEETKTEENSSSVMTGLVTLKNTTIGNKTFYYVIGAIVLLGIIVFIIRKRQSLAFRIPRSTIRSEPAEFSMADKIIDAERRIREAEAEIAGLEDKEIEKEEAKLKALKRIKERNKQRGVTN